jgi:Tfp pilus assembly protein PilF
MGAPSSFRATVDGMSDDWLKRGVAAQQRGDLRGAEDAYRRALDAGEPEAAYHLGDFLVQIGRPADAEEHLRAALASGDVDAHIPLGNALWDLGETAEAERHYRAAAQAGQAAGLHNLGLVLREQDRLEESAAAFRAAVPSEPDALVELAILLSDDLIGEAEEAEALLREAIDRGGRDAAIVLGSLLVEQERFAEAEAVLRAATAGGSLDAQVDLANLLSEEGDGAVEAEELYRDAIARGDRDAENNLGVLLRDLGRLDEARAHLRRAAERGDELARENLANLD